MRVLGHNIISILSIHIDLHPFITCIHILPCIKARRSTSTHNIEGGFYSISCTHAITFSIVIIDHYFTKCD